MDPDENLREQLKLAAVDWTGQDTESLTPAQLCELHNAHIRLCDLVQSLDGWIKVGGFLPARWTL